MVFNPIAVLRRRVSHYDVSVGPAGLVCCSEESGWSAGTSLAATATTLTAPGIVPPPPPPPPGGGEDDPSTCNLQAIDLMLTSPKPRPRPSRPPESRALNGLGGTFAEWGEAAPALVFLGLSCSGPRF